MVRATTAVEIAEAVARTALWPLRYSVQRLFSHGEPPLGDPGDAPGDIGLCGPDSVSWTVIGHPAAFLGGIRGLILQTAHPEVLAGVVDHSTYAQDPLGRLSRTANWVSATTFGSRIDVERAVAHVLRAHTRVAGTSPRGRRYSASDPTLGAFVHNTLTDSFLTAYQTMCRPGDVLSVEQCNQFVVEQNAVGELLGIQPQVYTAGDLSAWIVNHPDLDVSDDTTNTLAFLARPPLPPGTLAGYRILHQGAVATIDPALRQLLNLTARPGAVEAARATTSLLACALGDNPTRRLAHERCAAQ